VASLAAIADSICAFKSIASSRSSSCISDAISQTEIDLRSYIKEHPDFKEVGERILQEWVKARQLSLQAG